MSDLRDRLDAAASAVEPSTDLWSTVEHRVRVHRRRPVILVAIAAAAAVIAVALIVPKHDGGTTQLRIPAGAERPTGWRELPPGPLDGQPSVSPGVWVHDQMIFVGGSQTVSFSPATNSWANLPPSPLDDRSGAAEVAMGGKLFEWAGSVFNPSDPKVTASAPRGDGAILDPGAKTWTSIPRSPLSARIGAIAEWTGTEVLVVGGRDAARTPLVDGAAFNPSTRQWRRLPPVPLTQPDADRNASVWTGRDLIIAGGADGTKVVAYSPATDRWRDLAPLAAPEPDASAVWTGHEVLLWGLGASSSYDPGANRWTPLPPLARASDTGYKAVWTGAAMILWGGTYPVVYDAASSRWLEPLAGGPTSGPVSTIAWTGAEMLVWAGYQFGRGWAYVPPAEASALKPAIQCPTSQELAARANRAPVVTTVTSPYEINDIAVEPPPTGVVPPVSAQRAIAAAASYGQGDPGPSPTISFVKITAPMFPNGALVWLVVRRFAEVAGGPSGGPGFPNGEPPPSTAPPPPCSLGTVAIAIDAGSGAALFESIVG